MKLQDFAAGSIVQAAPPPPHRDLVVPELLLLGVETDGQAGYVEADAVKAMEGILLCSAHVVFAWLGFLLLNRLVCVHGS